MRANRKVGPHGRHEADLRSFCPGSPGLNFLAEACALLPGANLALISTPGTYATAEALKALKRGLHVFLIYQSERERFAGSEFCGGGRVAAIFLRGIWKGLCNIVGAVRFWT